MAASSELGSCGLLPAGYIRVFVFTTRLAIGTQGNKIEITVLSRVLIVIIPAPGILQAGWLDIGPIPAFGIT
jgi:hypothetical protein